MATLQLPSTLAAAPSHLKLSHVARFRGLRTLAWHGDVLYASRNYELLRTRVAGQGSAQPWQHVADVQSVWWRQLTSRSRPAARLCRDGFHALATLASGELIGAISGAIVTLIPGDQDFRITHRVLRGSRPLHFAVTSSDHIFWGEYFDNAERAEAYIYGSTDRGLHWDVAYVFPRKTIRHVHNIVYDRWEDCLWILTGDNGPECRILRASCDLKEVESVLSGTQQTRAAALIPMRDALYFSSDTPSELNHIYRLERSGNLSIVADLSSSSICGCSVDNSIFFSTMVEPSHANPDCHVRICGSVDGRGFTQHLSWKKDAWPMRLFQYGNAFFPDGTNTTGILAVTTIAVKHADCETNLWQVSHSPSCP